MIDPNQPEAKTQITYPKVLEFLRVNPKGNAVEWWEPFTHSGARKMVVPAGRNSLADYCLSRLRR